MANPQGPIEPLRLKGFARFFKNYMSVSALVTAALPIPITSFGLIPTFKAQTHFLSVYTSLYCFLLLGFIFYSRHLLARLMFPDPDYIPSNYILRWQKLVAFLPAFLILTSLTCVYLYHIYLQEALDDVVRAKILFPNPAGGIEAPTTESILVSADIRIIPMSGLLIISYLGIFLFAESAFIVMAIKEYLQDLLGLSEVDLIQGRKSSPANQSTSSPLPAINQPKAPQTSSPPVLEGPRS